MLCATGSPLLNTDESSTSSTSREAVCNIPTIFVIIAKLSGGTSSHSLNAEISCVRMPFPGCEIKYSYGPCKIFSFSADQLPFP